VTGLPEKSKIPFTSRSFELRLFTVPTSFKEILSLLSNHLHRFTSESPFPARYPEMGQ
jgi:hypothetical protein